MMKFLHLCGMLVGISVVHGFTIAERLEILEGQQRENVKENDNIRRLLTEQHTIITKQQTKIETQDKVIGELKAEIQILKGNFASTERQVEINTLLISVLRRENQKYVTKEHREPQKENDKNTIVDEETVLEPRTISRGIRQVSGGIAFSVYLDHDIDHAGKYQTVKYNKVLLNDGNGYNIHSGVFTCSESGVYLFSYFIGERDLHQATARLVKNSVLVNDAVVETVHAMQDLQGGNVAIIRANSGDVLSVELFADVHLEGSSTIRISTFSGVFLYA